MKNVYLFILFFALCCNALFAQQRWDSASLNIQKLFPYNLRAVDEKVAWVITLGGNFSTSPWYYVDTAHHFSRTADGGKSWSSGTYPSVGGGFAANIFPLSYDTAWVAHNDYVLGGVLYRTFDGGETWTNRFSAPRGVVDWVHFWDKKNGTAVFDPDSLGFGIYKTTTSGVTWQRVASLPKPYLGEYAFSGNYATSGDVMVFPTNKGRIFRSNDCGQTWTVSSLLVPAEEPNDISCDDNGNCLLTSGNYTGRNPFTGRFHYSSDTGKTWRPRILNEYSGTAVEYIPGTSLALAAVRENNSYLTGHFRLLLTADHGLTWQVIDSTLRIKALSFMSRTSGLATEYQNDDTESMIYYYIGSPLVGLWSREILRGGFEVSPNPVVSDNLHISLSGFETNDYRLLVNNVAGELVYAQNISFSEKQELIVPVNNWQSGIYILTLTSNKGSVNRKVVKTH